MEGEADPRNLLVVFSMVMALIRSGLTLQPFVEELFEVVAAYFPIEFVPVSPILGKNLGVLLCGFIGAEAVS